jgi:probable HAF family extracellular repeat protein
MKRRLTNVFFLLCCGRLLVPNPAQAARYRFTDLGLGSADAVNAQGQATGNNFFYDHGAVVALPTFTPWSLAAMQDITDDGVIAGWCTGGNGGRYPYEYDIATGRYTSLSTLNNGGGGAVKAITLAGIAAGTSGIGGGNTRAVRWTRTTHAEDLGTLGGASSSVSGMNEAGQIVGWAHTDSGEQHAFLYSGGTMTDLGTLGGDWSTALAINALGQVVGQSTTADGSTHAFLWEAGQMRELTTSSVDGMPTPAAVNSRGQMVGHIYNPWAGGTACLYENGQSWILNDLVDLEPGWELAYAKDINEAGEIVGLAYHGDAGHAYLLTPIPEPSAAQILAVGSLLFVLTATRGSATRTGWARCEPRREGDNVGGAA